MNIQWEDPPTKKKRQGKWEPIFDILRQNPMKWAKLSEGKDRNSHSLAGRLRKQFNDNEDFEIVSQTISPEVAGVWARYNPTWKE